MRWVLRNVVVLALAVGLLASASPPAKPFEAVGAQADGGTVAPLLAKLRRTACYGTCPVYSVTIRQDGTVEYEGIRFVKVLGRRTAKLAPRKLASLRAAFQHAKFFELKDRFACYQVTDQPSAFVTYRSGDHERTLKHYYGCLGVPKTLGKLEHEIDVLVGTVKWVGTREERRDIRR